MTNETKSSVARGNTKTLWQIVNSIVPYVLLWFAMVRLYDIAWPLALLLAPLAAGFLVRIFIIQHDCGHGSFFKSRLANDVVGVISSIFTLTPYRFWRKTHAIHHAHHAELEERGLGDVWTMTVDEYLQAPWWKRFSYRVFRQPIFLFFTPLGDGYKVIRTANHGANRDGENIN